MRSSVCWNSENVASTGTRRLRITPLIRRDDGTIDRFVGLREVRLCLPGSTGLKRGPADRARYFTVGGHHRRRNGALSAHLASWRILRIMPTLGNPNPTAPNRIGETRARIGETRASVEA